MELCLYDRKAGKEAPSRINTPEEPVIIGHNDTIPPMRISLMT